MDLTETDADAQLRMTAQALTKLEELEVKMDRLLAFAEKVETQWAAFQGKGIFGVLGGFSKR